MVCVNVDIDLSLFEDADLIEELKARGYGVSGGQEELDVLWTGLPTEIRDQIKAWEQTPKAGEEELALWVAAA